MLQIDHVYEFFAKTMFSDYCIYYLPRGVYENKTIDGISRCDIHRINEASLSGIMFIDQEPLINLAYDYIKKFMYPRNGETLSEFIKYDSQGTIRTTLLGPRIRSFANFARIPIALVTSEKSKMAINMANTHGIHLLYYFFHGFAAIDWFRGYYAMNHNKQIVKEYAYDFISMNRLIITDRSYRCYLVSKFAEMDLLKNGLVSFGMCGDWRDEVQSIDTKLSPSAVSHINEHLPKIRTPIIIDREDVPGYVSADIPRQIDDSFWHIVSETVFYYNKLHLTEKIFKPIVSKQPFMLIGAAGNLEYLKSYGFRTFSSIIDESYDRKVNPDTRIEMVVGQLKWYCDLSEKDKLDVMREIEPIVEYNFHHFYGEFKHIITTELIDNCKDLFKKTDYDDSNIVYSDIYKTLVN